MTVEALLSRLTSVRQAGNNAWRAKCPAHSGDNPTALSIRETGDGAVLLHCHAHGCSVESIADAVGLELADLFPPRDLPAGTFAKRGMAKPWRTGDVIKALRHEVSVGIVILQDVSKDRPIPEVDRRRAALAAAYMAMFMSELEHAH